MDESEKEDAVPPSAMRELMMVQGQSPAVVPQAMNLFQGNPQFFMNNTTTTASGRHSTPTIPGAPSFFAAPAVAQLPGIETTATSVEAGYKKKKEGKRQARKKQTRTKVAAPGSSIVTKKGGQSSRYTKEETRLFLDLVDDIKPIGKIAWEQVTDKFNAKVEFERQRDIARLQAKFRELHSKKQPTGDPEIPPEVLRAKAIQESITHKSNMINADDMSEESGEVVMYSFDDNREGFEDEDYTPAGTKTTGLSDEETTTKKKRNERTGRSVSSKKKKKPDPAADFLQAFIESEKASARREREQQRRQDRKDKKVMKLVVGLACAAMSSFGGNVPSDEVVTNINSMFDDDSSMDKDKDDESDQMSSTDGGESHPTKKL